MLKFTLSSSQVSWRKRGRPDGFISNKPLDGVYSQQTCVTLNVKQACELHGPAEASSHRIFTAKAGINPIILCVVFVVDEMALDQVFVRACCSAASHFFFLMVSSVFTGWYGRSILGAFAKLRKRIISFVMPVVVRME